MDKKTKSKIENFVFDCTIGIGGDPEDMYEPDYDSITAFYRFMWGAPTNEEMDWFISSWARCVQEMSQP